MKFMHLLICTLLYKIAPLESSSFFSTKEYNTQISELTIDINILKKEITKAANEYNITLETTSPKESKKILAKKRIYQKLVTILESLTTEMLILEEEKKAIHHHHHKKIATHKPFN